jgi:two-component system NtrC family sensor kinase
VARDVTERKRAELDRNAMEVELRHAQKLEAIGQLAAGIAHEINTPTQYIGDNIVFLKDAFGDVIDLVKEQSEMLKQAMTDKLPLDQVAAALERMDALDFDFLKDEIPRAIQQSQEGVARVTKIVGAMKEFSHPGGDVKEHLDINRAIESTTTVSRNEWKYVAELELEMDPDLPLVPCFPGEFNQVILNLVVNAAHAIEEKIGGKSSSQKGLIRIQTSHAGKVATVRISDSGTGIPEHIRARIFEPFFTTKPVGKGTGQGLSIVHHVIVDKHGGSIELESKMGEGTTFILNFPLEA